MKRIACLIALSVLAPTAISVTNPTAAFAQDVRQRIMLSGPAIGGVQTEGKAEYRVAGAKRKLQVEVQANLADGTKLTVLVKGSPIGVITIAGHVAKVELDTERGQSVPIVAAGTSVAVKTSAGATIVSGSF